MGKIKKAAALVMAFTACLTVNVTAASYADTPVSALTVIAEIKDVHLEKETISPGESTQLSVEWGVGATLAAQFHSSDTNVVKVENSTSEGCTLTGVGAGTAVITVSNDIYSETVEVTVKDESDGVTYEIGDGSIVFSNYSNMTSYVISSVDNEYDMACEETKAVFTPKENGKYVITVDEYCEEIFDYSIMDGHFHYFYPVLTNYTVNVTDDGISVNKEGSYSYYSEEQVEAQKNMTYDIAIDENGNVPAPDFTVYANGTENDMYALNEAYFSFLNGVFPYNEDNGGYDTYITTIHNEYKSESYFCLNAPYCGDESDDPKVLVSDNDLAEVMAKMYTSSYVDGNLQTGTCDIMDFYRVKALKDGKVTVSTSFDEIKECELEIKDGVFKRADNSEEITDLEYYIQSPSTIAKATAPIMIKGNQALIRFGLVSQMTGDILLKNEIKWEVTGTADSEFKYGKFENFYDPYGDEAWCLITAGSPGTVNIKGTVTDFYNNSTNHIYFNLTVNEDGSFDDNYTTEKPAESDLKGDANGDGNFTISDAVMLQSCILGKKRMTACQSNCADMNNDGAINIIDVVLMKIQLQNLESSKEKVVLTVETKYGGFGVAGQPLESGEFTETFEVAAGDILYEDINGHWTLNIVNSPLSEQICKIINVDSESITVSMGGFYINEEEYMAEEKEITLPYGELVTVFSKFMVDDGINYEHQIVFTKSDK